MVKQILTVSAWRVESHESRDFRGFSAKRKRSNGIAERNAVCLLSTIEAVHLPETTPVRPREVRPSDAASTIEKNFDMEANLALTVLPYIAAALGVAVFALATAPARVEEDAN
ncbi:hypothetical protein [Tardiphaga sp.]|jgi:hypothetical protein|uniref:hypothetical protein n=1 Tax=Tardiphaga sp. TaxID=1926292 RepID=UPI0037D9AB1D